MKLITKTIEDITPGLYETEETPVEEKLVTTKFFVGGLTWYMTEYDPSKKLAFGYVENRAEPMNSEWGYFSIMEFEEYNKDKPFLMIERDLHFSPTKFKELDL